MSLYMLPCMQREPNSLASRTPFQCGAGRGAFQRSAPTGGAANGMPLKAATPLSTVPFTLPAFVLTTSGKAARNRQVAMQNRISLGYMPNNVARTRSKLITGTGRPCGPRPIRQLLDVTGGVERRHFPFGTREASGNVTVGSASRKPKGASAAEGYPAGACSALGDTFKPVVKHLLGRRALDNACIFQLVTGFTVHSPPTAAVRRPLRDAPSPHTLAPFLDAARHLPAGDWPPRRNSAALRRTAARPRYCGPGQE